MTNKFYLTASLFAIDGWTFFRPQNAEITKDLLSAFVPVNRVVGESLIAGQHYMGGIAYQNCSTKWFFSELGKTGIFETVGPEVAEAFRAWFNEGAKAEAIFDEVKNIVFTTAQKLDFIIDISMVYSLVHEYLKSWVIELQIREREDREENPPEDSDMEDDPALDVHPTPDEVNYAKFMAQGGSQLVKPVVPEEPEDVYGLFYDDSLVWTIDNQNNMALVLWWPQGVSLPSDEPIYSRIPHSVDTRSLRAEINETVWHEGYRPRPTELPNKVKIVKVEKK